MRSLILVVFLFSFSFNASAVQSCKITVKDSNNSSIHEVLYGRGDSIGGKSIGKGKDCDVCRSGGRNEGPALCAQHGGDNYTIKCVKNSGKQKTWDASC